LIPFVLPDGSLLITGVDELVYGAVPYASDFNMLANGTRLHSSIALFYVAITGQYNATTLTNCDDWNTLDDTADVSYGAIDFVSLFTPFPSPWLHIGTTTCDLTSMPWPSAQAPILELQAVVFCVSNSFLSPESPPTLYEVFLRRFAPWLVSSVV